MHALIGHSNDNTADAGLFTWDLVTDTLYADSALSELFGLGKVAAERGLPLVKYLNRIFAEDRPAVVAAVRRAIVTGNPFQESYRVHRSNGDLVHIAAFGKCFRDGQGEPRLYAGIVFPMPENKTEDTSLLWHCLSALEVAKREGRDDVARSLVAIIRTLGNVDLQIGLAR